MADGRSEKPGNVAEGHEDESLPPSSASLPPSERHSVPPVYLQPRKQRPVPILFKQGAHAPYGIRWYGITSLYGHFRGFIARAVAAEAVDSRDWMRPQTPVELLEETCDALGGSRTADTLVESIGRPVFIDFVADTGDDYDTSQAVGDMLFRDYRVLQDGQERSLPRGDMLIFGGDIAYPVATAEEIFRRLVRPWNESLRAVRGRGLTKKRVVLGVPGNHDWYDGLDGFGRLFRKSVDLPIRKERKKKHSLLDQLAKLGKPLKRATENRNVGLVARQLHIDEVQGFFRLFGSISRSIRALISGGGKRRRRRLKLHGYTPVQQASYFMLPLAPGLDLWGADRQLGRMDFRQRSFFRQSRKQSPMQRLMFVASDPVLAYGELNGPGSGLLQATKLSLHRDEILYLTGDFHHYERRKIGDSLHVIAGGGGAFLHGTRITPSPSGPNECQYPPAEISKSLVRSVPWKLVGGRAGYLAHLCALLVAALELWASKHSAFVFYFVSILLTTLITTGFVLFAGPKKKNAFALSLPFGITIGVLPMILSMTVPRLFPNMVGNSAVLIAYSLLGSFLFGGYLAGLALLGLEHQQAFTVLGHGGYKHFIRLCVHPTGKVEGWVIGKDEPLSTDPPELVDTFTWEAQLGRSVRPAASSQSDPDLR